MIAPNNSERSAIHMLYLAMKRYEGDPYRVLCVECDGIVPVCRDERGHFLSRSRCALCGQPYVLLGDLGTP